MKKHGILLAAAAALVLPSCVRWCIGDNVEDRFYTYTGVDVDKPVDGKVYRAGDACHAKYYMQAPEITYHACHPIVAFDRMDDSPDSQPSLRVYPKGVRRTGKLRWVEVAPTESEPVQDRHGRALRLPTAGTAWGYVKDVEALPTGAAVYLGGVDIKERGVAAHYDGLYAPERRAMREKQRGFMAKVCPAPFEYVVDPVLTTASTGIGLFGLVVLDMIEGPECRHAGQQAPLPEDVRRKLQGSTILGVRKGPGTAPYGAYIYWTDVKYRLEENGGGMRDEVAEYSNAATWAAELHAYAPKSRPCVLYFHRGEHPGEAELQAMAAPLRAQGFHVAGALYERCNGYTFKPLPADGQ